MKKLSLVAEIAMLATIAPQQKASAQIPIVDITKAAIKKAIQAADLQIQRQQNKVIWLQNAQKTMENAMSKAKLVQHYGYIHYVPSFHSYKKRQYTLSN